MEMKTGGEKSKFINLIIKKSKDSELYVSFLEIFDLNQKYNFFENNKELVNYIDGILIQVLYGVSSLQAWGNKMDGEAHDFQLAIDSGEEISPSPCIFILDINPNSVIEIIKELPEKHQILTLLFYFNKIHKGYEDDFYSIYDDLKKLESEFRTNTISFLDKEYNLPSQIYDESITDFPSAIKTLNDHINYIETSHISLKGHEVFATIYFYCRAVNMKHDIIKKWLPELISTYFNSQKEIKNCFNSNFDSIESTLKNSVSSFIEHFFDIYSKSRVTYSSTTLETYHKYLLFSKGASSCLGFYVETTYIKDKLKTEFLPKIKQLLPTEYTLIEKQASFLISKRSEYHKS